MFYMFCYSPLIVYTTNITDWQKAKTGHINLQNKQIQTNNGKKNKLIKQTKQNTGLNKYWV